jgi:hypothetical protein
VEGSRAAGSLPRWCCAKARCPLLAAATDTKSVVINVVTERGGVVMEMCSSVCCESGLDVTVGILLVICKNGVF